MWINKKKFIFIFSFLSSFLFAFSSLALTISGVVADTTSTSAVLKWNTDQSTHGYVEYGTSTSYGSYVNDPSLTTSHIATLSNLFSSKTYYYKIWANTQGGMMVGTYSSAQYSGSFMTQASAIVNQDTTPPVISSVMVSSSGITSNSATIGWITDEPSASGVSYGINTAGELYYDDQNLTTQHVVNLTNLRPSTTYQYKVHSRDSSNNVSYSSIYYFTTASEIIAVIDTMPPAVISFLTESTTSGLAKITVTFSESVNQADLTSANIYLAPIDSPSTKINGVFSLTSNTVVFSASECLQNKFYIFTVSRLVKDLAGNQMSADFTRDQINLYSSSCSIATVTQTTKPGSLQGKVTDAGGSVVSGAYVYLHNSDFSLTFNVQSDASGNYLFSNITPGSYVLEVYAPQTLTNLLKPSLINITVSSGVILTQNLQFLAGSKIIKGKVALSSGVPVADAQVGAYQESSYSWTSAYVDFFGNYSLKVSGGNWSVMIMPKDSSAAKWVYNKPSAFVSFLNDQTSEEVIVDFQVDSVPSKISGKVLLPGGGFPKSGTIVQAVSSIGQSITANVGIDGNFSINLSAGIYTIEIFSSDPAYGSPVISAVTLLEGQALDLGTITLVAASSHIKGIVYNSQKVGQVNVFVSAKQIDGTRFASGLSGASGQYDLSVAAGLWEISVSGISTPQQVQVFQATTHTIDFILPSVDAVLSGVVKDSAGNILIDFYGYAILEPDFIGAPVERGVFKISAKAGSYTLRLDLSPGAVYTPADKIAVTLVSGQTKEVTITLSKNTSFITGSLKDTAGAVVTGVKGEVFASSAGGSFQRSFIDPTTGQYKLTVGPGIWYMGFNVDQATGYQAKPIAPGGISVSAGQTISQDIFIVRADSLISGAVKKSDGTALANVWVSISSRPIVPETNLGTFVFPTQEIETGAFSDQNGKFSVKVPAGAYFVRAFYSLEKGLIAPSEIKVIAASDKPVQVELIFKSSTSSISGAVFYNNAVQAGAFVFAWSEKGAHTETMTDKLGAYSLSVSGNDVWHIGARSESNADIFKSEYIIISVLPDQKLTVDLFLKKAGEIPKPILTTVDVSKSQVMTLSDRAEVSLPPNSMGTAGQASVSIKSSVEAPDQARSSIIGKVYDVEITDIQGKSITTFNAPISITIPYNKKEIEKLGISEDEIKPSFFDEISGTWKKADKFVIDKTNSQVVIEVSHLTRFALVAAADITPPEAPGDIDVAKVGPGSLFLSWANPTKDFDHIKIYRSAKKGELGKVAFNDIKRTFETDTKLTGDIVYYYTIRTVDLAGNESTNVEQFSGTPEAVKGKTKFTFNKNLRQGVKNDDVKVLQEILFEEGVYPENIISGYFGPLTKKSVINFQKKYGISPAFGFVGSLTRAKLNELYGK